MISSIGTNLKTTKTLIITIVKNRYKRSQWLWGLWFLIGFGLILLSIATNGNPFISVGILLSFTIADLFSFARKWSIVEQCISPVRRELNFARRTLIAAEDMVQKRQKLNLAKPDDGDLLIEQGMRIRYLELLIEEMEMIRS